ncbi:MAG: Gfo/Idh/MocA family oxidoreductase [Kiritimatiellaeota bacterium]|nr:Gfo/Idh/MocA family oxidoreductase [Kiritimatiellota bacterium]
MAVRVALIGAVGHVGYVLDGLRELPQAVLCAAAPGAPDEDGESVRRVLARTGSGVFYADWRRLLDREQPDVVAVTPRFYRHAEIAAAVLQRGIPVYCEKPLALDLGDLERLREAQIRGRAALGIMLAFRYEPAFFTARRLVAAGVIGEPTVGYAQKSYKRGVRPEFYKRRAGFGGIIPWVGIHAVDWFRWVSGREYAAVVAQHVKLHAADYPELEDAATCLFELENGGSAAMSFDFLRPAGAPTHGDDRLRLLGERGALEVRGKNCLELITEDGVERPELESPAHGPFADFVLSVVEPTRACLIPGADAFRVTEIVLRTRDAADRGKRVDLRPGQGS